MRGISKKAIKQRLKVDDTLENAQIYVMGNDKAVNALSLERVRAIELLVKLVLKRKLDDKCRKDLTDCLEDINKLYEFDGGFKLTDDGEDWITVHNVLLNATVTIIMGVNL